jgi:hypothetical protein
MLIGIQKTGENIEQTVGDANPMPVTIAGADAVDNAMSVVELGSNELVYSDTAAWANSATANTIVNKDITLPATLYEDGVYLITVNNPSAVTAVTVSVRNKETLAGTARYPELTQFIVPASNVDGRSCLVQGWMRGEGARLTLSNQTALGASDGFAVSIKVRRI